MAGKQLVYVGTYTAGESEGIYVYELDESSGALTQVGDVVPAVNAGFLALDATGERLYAVTEVEQIDGAPGGLVSAYSVDAGDGRLTLMNQQPSGGNGPCHISVDPAGRAVFVANYGSGHATMIPLGTDGTLDSSSCVVQHVGSSVNADRQEGPHAHSMTPSPDGRYVVACDLGIDKVLVYKVDYANGTLPEADATFVRTAAGAGPRHFAFHPSGEHAYVINELDSTANAFTYDGVTGALSEIQSISTLPGYFDGTNYPSDIHVSADGRFVYGSNRIHDSLVIYSVDAASGRLALVGHEPTQGVFPRNFGIDLSGDWLLAANQETGTIVSFRVDHETGRLAATGHVTELSQPACVQFLRLDA